MVIATADWDTPWKEALERYFPEFLQFFFPWIYNDIDWTKGCEFLDKELQQIVRDAERGRRLVDKLVKVWRCNGEETWVLVHLEIQGQWEIAFPKRMYIYHYRIEDRYDRPVVSLAVLTDDDISWRPNRYTSKLWRCRVSLKFPIVKLLDYESRWNDLEQNTNPFAIVVMAHLKAKATRQDAQTRLQWKKLLAKNLYQRGYSRQDILELLRFIDWLLVLPDKLELEFEQTLKEVTEETKMPYLATFERRAMRKASLQTAREYVIDVLKIRLESVPDEINDRIHQIEDLVILKQLLLQASVVDSIEAFQQFLDNPLAE